SFRTAATRPSALDSTPEVAEPSGMPGIFVPEPSPTPSPARRQPDHKLRESFDRRLHAAGSVRRSGPSAYSAAELTWHEPRLSPVRPPLPDRRVVAEQSLAAPLVARNAPCSPVRGLRSSESRFLQKRSRAAALYIAHLS